MGLDYYGLLEISRNALDEDIKKAYRRLALKYHPKRNEDPSLGDRFTAIAEAYDVLSRPRFRALFDQFGEEALKRGVPVPPDETQEEGPVVVYTFHGDPEKVYRDFFGVDSPFADYYLPNVDPGCRFLERAAPAPGPDLERPCPLTLEEAYRGCTKSLGLPLRVVDETGTGTVDKTESFTFRVPRGTRDGTTFTFRKAGSSGPNMTPGDVTFRVEIERHPDFRLEGSDLVVGRSLSLAQALTGCRVDVETFDGKTFHLPISEVVKPGMRTVLKNEGMPVAGSSEKGDLIVEFDVTFPERLSSKQKALIKRALLKRKK